jgi:hypothetical protein
LVAGQQNLRAAVAGTLQYRDKASGKQYELKAASQRATLMVRPRGWHLPEQHFTVDGQPMSASLFDFGLYFFHNAHAVGDLIIIPPFASLSAAALFNSYCLETVGEARYRPVLLPAEDGVSLVCVACKRVDALPPRLALSWGLSVVHHREARLWNDVFNFSQSYVGLPLGYFFSLTRAALSPFSD